MSYISRSLRHVCVGFSSGTLGITPAQQGARRASRTPSSAVGCHKTLIRINKLVVASLCTPEELAQEPYKSMGNSARLLKQSLECEMQYYKAYSKKLEEQLH
ncbi:hypothetical protein B0H10DRAFT_1962706 [Mycena sp. CBHHK59/15]|nr:hypothetical protein B0H10DRAFT_1962706 [Mycena sp. CBHHK59/15]